MSREKKAKPVDVTGQFFSKNGNVFGENESPEELLKRYKGVNHEKDAHERLRLEMNGPENNGDIMQPIKRRTRGVEVEQENPEKRKEKEKKYIQLKKIMEGLDRLPNREVLKSLAEMMNKNKPAEKTELIQKINTTNKAIEKIPVIKPIQKIAPEIKKVNTSENQREEGSLKTSVEIAMSGKTPKKKNSGNNLYSEVIFEKDSQPPKTEEAENRRFEQEVGSANSFEELRSVIEKMESAHGTEKWFLKNSLLGRLHLVEVGESSPEEMPNVFGIRDKAKELIKKTEVRIYKPDTKEKGTTTRPSPGKESLIKGLKNLKMEAALHSTMGTFEEGSTQNIAPKSDEKKEGGIDIQERIRTLFVEIMNEKIQVINKAREIYGRELAKKIRDDQTKTRLQKLKIALKMAISNKPDEATKNFLDSKDAYEAAIEDFSFCLEGAGATKEYKDIISAGSISEETIQKMKTEVGELMITIILKEEKEKIQNIEKNLYKEKDKKTIDLFESLYKRAKTIEPEASLLVKETRDDNAQ